MFVSINDHSKLRSPIAKMVIRNHGMPQELEDLGNGIADDSGTNVTDMHRFRYVGRRKIDDIRFRFGSTIHSEPIRFECDIQLFPKIVVGEPQIYVACPRDAHFRAQVVNLDFAYDRFCNFDGRFADNLL